MLRITVATGLLAALPGWVTAQTATSPVLLDSRVRVTTESSPDSPSVGSLREWDAGSIELSASGSAPMTIPLTDVMRLEISRGKKGHALAGTVAGAAVGLVLGLVAVSSTQEPDPDAWFRLSESEENTLQAGAVVVTTLAGAGLGALIGALIKTEEWEDVRIPEEMMGGPPTVATSRP